jgi:hypothetical protein
LRLAEWERWWTEMIAAQWMKEKIDKDQKYG